MTNFAKAQLIKDNAENAFHNGILSKEDAETLVLAATMCMNSMTLEEASAEYKEDC